MAPLAKRKLPLIPERLLARLWQTRAQRRSLSTVDGRRVRVLYPGRRNGGPGPDFRDAMIQVDGSPPQRGDVEVHLTDSGWRQHGHHEDPNYNNVVLHVVMRPRSRGATERQDGSKVPVTSLSATDGEAEAPLELPLLRKWRSLEKADLILIIEEAGERRFRKRSNFYLGELLSEDADELLYRGIMDSLGYSRNRDAFLKLSYLAPWRRICQVGEGLSGVQRVSRLKRFLVMTAGLELEKDRSTVRTVSLGEEMDPAEWSFAGVRPGNQPLTRIEGAAVLAARFLDTGLVRGLRPAVTEDGPRPLVGALTASGGGRTLIGKSRAQDMAVNHVLPFFHAWSVLVEDGSLAENALRLYWRAPRLADNEMTREMASLLEVERRLLKGALAQQGLIQMYRDMLAGDVEGGSVEVVRERGAAYIALAAA